MSNVFFDLETSGLDPYKHSIITGHFYDDSNGQEFSFRCKPLEGRLWDKGAEKIHGISQEEAMSYRTRSEILPNLMKWFDGRKGNLVAHCQDTPMGWFDFAFLKEFGTVHIDGNIPYLLFRDHLKLKSMSTIQLLKNLTRKGILPIIMSEKGRPTYRLDKWSDYFSIHLNHHEAKSDTMACCNIYRQCREIFDIEVSIGRIDEEDWENIAKVY